MNALFAVLGVMGSNLDQSQGMNPENDVSTKKVEFGENSVIYSQLLALRKDVFVPYLSLQCIKLPDDALVDPLGVRGSNLVQKKGMNAENGVRPKKKKKVGTSRKNAGTSRKNTLNWKMTSWPIPWELEAQTWSKRKV